ncbi:FAD/NAD(P)-binding domain-containing protein [Ophiobolus disseminans]|uniref:FAD/NAD(P)-binding domain-containing protein n=1 Tax=Ophiobolus disseminans TaxID=1469910 RepID=A0A6A6ZUX7_9PLEO|nr:FAD/NAD(P)-binding domain-containing protein [Ophiobolus disseminans]
MTDQPPKLKVLVSGSGIAGPTFAYWLNELLPTSDITILERAPEPRFGGQAVDLRSAAIPIVERMGLLPKVKELTTTEEGIEFIYADGKTKASFPATGNDQEQSMTSEYEILRGDMARIIYETTQNKPGIKYIFAETITSISEPTPGSVHVTFANSLPPATFDLVVGADGMMSRTRRYVFGHGPNDDDFVHRLGQYSAYFTIPRTQDDTTFAQWYNATRGRLILKRPDRYGTTRVYMSVTDSKLSRFDEIDALLRNAGKEAQQAWFEREFAGAGWLTDRCVRGMKDSEDFYLQQIAQVKMPVWHRGNVALVGDAAFCPSPISGVGTGSAIIGAYILAGELSLSPSNIPGALARYDTLTRPFIDSVQKLIPGAPQIANPQTAWGVWLFNKMTGVVAHPASRVFGGLVGRVVPAFGKGEWEAPEYGVVEGGEGV